MDPKKDVLVESLTFFCMPSSFVDDRLSLSPGYNAGL